MAYENKIAIVTGGASGIGKATATKLAAAGATVIIADIDGEGAQATASECGAGAIAVRCDVTSADDILEVFARVKSIGSLDVLINNAGAGGSQKTMLDFDLSEWDQTMSLLLRSAAIFTHHAAHAMEKGGAIVNVASVAGFGAGYSPIAYAVAKAGVLQLTKVSAAQLAHRNIRVNAVCPGMVLTGIYTAGLDDHPEISGQVNAHMEAVAPLAQPLQMAGRPEHVADSICYLASEAAGFVTGTHLLVDGGMLVGPRHSWDPTLWEERRLAQEKLYSTAQPPG